MAAVPGAGAIIEVGKIVNDASRAIGDVASAASEATSTISKVVEETSKNIDEGLDKLEEKKERMSNAFTPPSVNLNPGEDLNKLNKVGGTITNRVEKSIDEFENPVSSAPVLTGGRKTRKKFLKRKGKSKRVRFAI